MIYSELLLPYNPWWAEATKDNAFNLLPKFHRPVFEKIYKGVEEVPQIISVTGPRRVGKSTLIKQVIRRLIEDGVKAEKIIYYSMDDPALYRSEIDHDKFFDAMMQDARRTANDGLTYIFLDEIQRFGRWELFLKKYYDLNYPIRFIVSGSASSPIFKKSRESLLGRIKDFHILPFSFREFLLYQIRDKQTLVAQFNEIHTCGNAIAGMLTQHLDFIDHKSVKVVPVPVELKGVIDSYLAKFFLEGGFPEVWGLPDWEAKQSYLFENHVNKVIMEDLVLAVELRKPEQLKRFYVSLLTRPGIEINLQQVSSELEVSRATLEKFFPLLEMTELIRHVEKFTRSPLKVRRGNMKCYLVDLALRNAILRLQDALLGDAMTLGLYAENLVFNALKEWEGTIDIGYFREKGGNEIDFIVHTCAGAYHPVEVKYQEHITEGDLKGIRYFYKRHKPSTGFVITKKWDDFGMKDNLIYLPLPHFLMLFS